MENKADRSAAMLFAATVAGYPLVAAVPAILGFDSHGLAIVFRAAYLGLAGLMLLRNFATNREYRGSAWFPVLSFWMLYGFRIASDAVYRPIQLKLAGSEYVLWALGTCFIPMLGFFADPGRQTIKLAAKCTFWLSAVALLAALYMNYLELASGASGAYASGRLGSETLNPVALGHLGVAAMLMSLSFFPSQRWGVRVGLAALMLIGLFTAAASGSRGPIVGLASCLLLQFLVWTRGRRAVDLALGAVIIGSIGWLLVLGAFSVEDHFGFRIISRFQGGASGTSQSTALHVSGFSDARDQFLSHPILGSALDELNSHDYPHNVLVESFMATGIVGGFMFSVFFVWSGLSVISLAKDADTRWLAFLITQQLITGVTAGALYLDGGLWCLCAAGIAIAASNRVSGNNWRMSDAQALLATTAA